MRFNVIDHRPQTIGRSLLAWQCASGFLQMIIQCSLIDYGICSYRLSLVLSGSCRVLSMSKPATHFDFR